VARCEDPNRCEIVALPCELPAWAIQLIVSNCRQWQFIAFGNYIGDSAYDIQEFMAARSAAACQ
jgi:hypothetical protein